MLTERNDAPLDKLQKTEMGFTEEKIEIFQIYMGTKRNWGWGAFRNFPLKES